MSPSLPRPPVSLLITALATLVLFGWMSRPLLLHATEAIPSSARNIEHPPVRTNIAGDHLQLLYHYDLVGDMLAGHIRFLHNPYEFNTGHEDERFVPGSYFFPLSGIYALLRPWTGQALAWNLCLWISVWMSAWFGWQWLGGFTSSVPARTLGVGILLSAPFRWASLFGGSPSGSALMWVPLYAWMLDRALRRLRIRDGFTVGAAMLLLYWGDIQVFYLTMVTTPVLIGLTLSSTFPDFRTHLRRGWRLLPGGLISGLVISVFYLWRRQHLSGSHMSDGRSFEELALFSPRLPDLVSSVPGPGETIYVGWILLTLLAMGLGVALTLERKRLLAVYLFALLCTALGVCLALGAFGPGEGAVITLARTLVPYYDMIRQPFKIFGVVPVWMAWMCAVAFAAALDRMPRHRGTLLALGTAGMAGVIWSQGRHVDATISRLEHPQPVYAAVAEDAERLGIALPRVLVVPLWPGDAADTSLPMHFAQREHLRLVNGYSPVVSTRYTEEIFQPLSSVNQGVLAEAQAAQLREIGVRHLILHEDQFPEKVSPFPVRETLRRLNAHPLLEPLVSAGPIHAFRLRPAPDSASPDPLPPRLRPPARRYDAGRLPEVLPDQRRTDAAAFGGAAATLSADLPELRTPPARFQSDPDLRWWIRVRGSGVLGACTLTADVPADPAWRSYPVESSEWTWLALPLDPRLPGFAARQLALRGLRGELEADLILLSGSRNLLDLPSEGVRLPAADFFHAGYADPETGSVHLRTDYEPDRIVWYGPMLPLRPGTYRIRVRHRSAAPSDTVTGELVSGYYGSPPAHRLPVTGEVTEWTWIADRNLLWRLDFHYHRAADLELIDVELVPLPEE